MKRIFFGLIFFATFASVTKADHSAGFFAHFSQLCDAQLQGEMVFPTDAMDDFSGKVLTARVTHCDASQIQIAFDVGEDKSRTWFIRKTDTGLELKHRHLLKDGSLDPVTNYGGLSDSSGSEYAQAFPADAFTQELIPAASTNVWNLELSKDLKTLTYHLERHNKPRFTAVLYLDE